MADTLLTIEQVNNLSKEEFIRIFGNVVELYPSAAKNIVENRPFQDVNSISNSINTFLDNLPFSEKEKILQLHPDLAGKLADLGKLSSESTEEQKSAGLDKLSAEDKSNLTQFNEMYKTKFGFPFVICVKENKFVAILNSIQQRLKNDKNLELLTGIEEVKKISKIRIFLIVKH